MCEFNVQLVRVEGNLPAKLGSNVMTYSGASSEPLETFEINSSSNGSLCLVFKLTIKEDGS